MKILICFFLLCSFSASANQKVALVKLLRGEVKLLAMGKTSSLKLQDWVSQGDIVQTGEKSFVKLVFIDKSQMNVGPTSEMKIEKFNEKEPGVIDLVKGKIRSQVSKDYLQIQDQDRSKLFIKTANAAMGVRGTDFMVTTNGLNTATVLFEGSVVFNHLTERGPLTSEKLEDIVDRGVRIQPGEFSVVEQDRPQPTVPAVLNLKQRETLETNASFEASAPQSSDHKIARSVVPEGLSGKEVSNVSATLKTEVAQVSQDISIAPPATAEAMAVPAQGFVDGDTVRPANGSFLHLDSGVVIPPAADSVFDPNTNSFIPGPGNGTVSADGDFVPPKNVEITDEGKVLIALPQPSGEVKVVEVVKPSPVANPAAASLTQVVEAVKVIVASAGDHSGTANANTAPKLSSAAPSSTAKASAAGSGSTPSTPGRTPSAETTNTASSSPVLKVVMGTISTLDPSSFSTVVSGTLLTPPVSGPIVNSTTTTAAPIPQGGIDLTTSVIQRTNGRLNIDVISQQK